MSIRGLKRALALMLALILTVAAGVAEEGGEAEPAAPEVQAEALAPDPTPEPLPDPEPAPEAPATSGDVPQDTPETPDPVPQDAPADASAESPTEATVPDAPAELQTEGSGDAPQGEAVPDAPLETPGEEMPAAGDALPQEIAPAVAAPELPEPDLYLGLGERYALGKSPLLDGLTGVTDCVSAQPDVVSVDVAKGVIIAQQKGVAQLTVVAADGAMREIVAAVLDAPTGVALPAKSMTLGKGETASLAAQLPEGTASVIAYSSSKSSVVKVDAAGNITARKTGTAVITAAAFNGQKATCKVTVKKAPSKATMSSKTLILGIGEPGKLTAKLPKNTASRSIAWSSSAPDVVSVDAAGNLLGAAPGTATVTAVTYNKKKTTCKVTVLPGAAPASVALNVASVVLGVNEKFALTPAIDEGCATVYTYSTAKKRTATVSARGVITGKRAGTTKITVKTHNGKKATVTVKVVKAPSKLTIAPARLTLEAGQTASLKVTLPKGSSSALTFVSSDPSVASVDAAGNVTALQPGTATVGARTYNGKKASCKVTVTAPAPTPTPEPAETPAPEPDETLAPEEAEPEPTAIPAPSAAQMAARLRADSSLGGKREAIAGIVELLVNRGFEPAFAAGMAANIYAEGTYGLFESSRYISNYQKRPRYFAYLDGGDYYTLKDGAYTVTAVYLSPEEYDAYEGEATKYLRFGEEKYYWNNYAGKYAYDVNLTALEAFLDALAAGKWTGKFGLGVVQWTGARTQKLVEVYRKHAGPGDTITKAQVIAAENEMILSDLTGSYKSVYAAWRNANAAPASTEAARSAGSLICLRYEIPADKESKAVTRGTKAASIYATMMGG